MALSLWIRSIQPFLHSRIYLDRIGWLLDIICGIDPQADSPDIRRIHHMLGLAIGSSIFICLFFARQFYLAVELVDVNVMAMLAVAFSSILNLSWLAWRRNLQQTVLIFLALAYALLTFLNYTNGGIDAPGISFYLVLPLFAMFLLGTRWAIVVTSLISVTFVIFFSLEASGHAFPHTLSENAIQWIRLLSLASVLGYIAMIAWFFEMTRRASMEKVNCTLNQLKLLNQELTTARDDAQAAAEAKSAFLASMSHEIRTPLNGVIGMTSLLLETPLNAEQQEFARTIRTSGDTLLTVINDILDFSKVEAGKIDLEHLPFDLHTCIEDVLDLLAPKVTSKDLELIYTIGEGTPPVVVGDVTRLRQILLNLVGNAIKFTEAGEVFVEVTGEPLGLGRHRLQFAVRDTGIGIPAERMDRLFQSFSQVDASTTRRFGGTGLGLAISKQLVELMGGSIWVESRPDVGSTFFFTIECNEAAEAPTHTFDVDASLHKGARILVVDDNATNRAILNRQLLSWGLQPTMAASGNEALSLLMVQPSFDLLLLDMQMPEMDGVMLAQSVQRKRHGDHGDKYAMPMVMLSSIADQIDDEIGKLFAATIMKPVKAAVLYQTIRDVLMHRDATPKVTAPAKAAPIWQDIAESRPLRILVAEDNPVNQRVALRMLERMGYRADMAGNGLEVLEALERQAYDVILMDIQMPELDGEETTQRIRRQDGLAQPTIIAMTANVLEDDRQRYLDLGMDTYICKPVRLQELADVLQRVPEKR